MYIWGRQDWFRYSKPEVRNKRGLDKQCVSSAMLCCVQFDMYFVCFRLEKVELGYTGINNQTYQSVHPHIIKLQQLTYLGLRGNKLDNSVVSLINKVIDYKHH